jgi:hypothetical protein
MRALPSLLMRARQTALATVRNTRMRHLAIELRSGLVRPRGSRSVQCPPTGTVHRRPVRRSPQYQQVTSCSTTLASPGLILPTGSRSKIKNHSSISIYKGETHLPLRASPIVYPETLLVKWRSGMTSLARGAVTHVSAPHAQSARILCLSLPA